MRFYLPCLNNLSRVSYVYAQFILSTWHSNQHRHNPYIDQFWSQFAIVNREHFYHVGAKETNRKPMLEAIVMNYQPVIQDEISVEYHQPRLLENVEEYTNS